MAVQIVHFSGAMLCTVYVWYVREIVRRKAVLCLHAFVCKVPELARQIHGYINSVLGDKDPGVVWAVVEVYRQLVQVCVFLSLCFSFVLNGV